MEPLPTLGEVQEDLVIANVAAAHSAELRRQLRRRTKKRDEQRAKQIEAMIEGLQDHGSVLRSHLKRSDYHDIPYTKGVRRNIRTTLAALRYERRQIKKMLPRSLAPS